MIGILILIAVVEIILVTIIKKRTEDNALTDFVAGGYDFFVGEMLKHFADERELEVVGIILLFAGIVQMAWAFFEVFAQIRDNIPTLEEYSRKGNQRAETEMKQISCPHCGTYQSSVFTKCYKCGASLPEKVSEKTTGTSRQQAQRKPIQVKITNGQILCPQCGTSQLPGRKNCYMCGLEFALEDESQG